MQITCAFDFEIELKSKIQFVKTASFIKGGKPRARPRKENYQEFERKGKYTDIKDEKICKN